MNGFNSAVSFSCSGLPAGATCAFIPTSVTPNASPVTTTLTVSTTAAGVAVHGIWPDKIPPLYAVLLSLAGMMLVMLSLRKTARLSIASVTFAALLTVLILLPLCGGSSTSMTGGNGGTPPGTDSVTISGATSGSGAITHGAMLTITITQ